MYVYSVCDVIFHMLLNSLFGLGSVCVYIILCMYGMLYRVHVDGVCNN